MMTVDYLIKRSAKKFGKRLALVDGDLRFTYEALNDRVNRLANGLLGMGLKKGDRVGVLFRNCHQAMESTLALNKAGFVYVPLNARYAGQEHVYMLNDSEANTVIYSKEFSDTIDQIRHQIPGVKNYICAGEAENAVSYEGLLDGSPGKEPDITISPEDLLYIRYTSGTTGKPKGVMLTHRNGVASIVNSIIDNVDIKPDDVMVHVGPITHASGALILPHFILGAANVLLKEFDPELFLQTIERERATTIFVVPTMLIVLLQHPGLAKYDLSSLKTIKYGAAPMPLEPLKEALRIFGPILTQGYGLTEAPLQDTGLRKEDHVVDGPPEVTARLASAGRELQLIQVRIVDDEGNELKPGEIGEIAIKGDNVMLGYWKNPEATAEKLRNGWLHTGDMAYKDEEGYIFIVDRKHDMIISGGFNIYPKEVEDAIYSHPSVSQCAVIGVPDDRWGESVKAVVVLKKGYQVTEQDIIDHCRKSIASYKKPKSVEFVDSIPVNPNGKVMRRELREKYWAGYTRRVN